MDHLAAQVAIKFIPDVTSSAEYVKRVLREVCILRRVSHPGIIQLKGAFVQPSSTGESCCDRSWAPQGGGGGSLAAVPGARAAMVGRWRAGAVHTTSRANASGLRLAASAA